MTIRVLVPRGRPAATAPGERPITRRAAARALAIVEWLVRAAPSRGRATEALAEGAGTALVIAEAGRVCGREDWRDLALAHFEPFVRGEASGTGLDGGLARGLGGLAYALLRTGRATGREQLVEAAVRLLADAGPRLAEGDRRDGLVEGRAGLLLAALAVHRERPDPAVLAVADRAARALVARARRTAAGARWPAPGPPVSHGASGIAMALARWAALRDDDEAAICAGAALRWDDQAWVPAERGWRHVGPDGAPAGPAATWSWCGGRAGLLLARAAVGAALGRRLTDERSLAALTAPVEEEPPSWPPGLCCGPAGILDAATEIDSRTGGGLLARAGAWAVSQLLDGMPRAVPDPPDGSLFRGTAGVAFALLRAVPSLRVPSILWFE